MSSLHGEPVDEPTSVVPFRPPSSVVDAFDISLGIGMAAFTVAGRVVGVAAAVVRPFVHLAMRPPLLDRSVAPETALHRAALRGTRVRVAAGADLEEASRQLVPAVADAVLDRLDLTDLVIERVDLVRVVDAVLDRLDLTELVLQRVDLDRIAAGIDIIGIANYVVDEIDLSEIIRVSTGSVATEAVSGVRMQSIGADAQLQRIVDRALLRRRARSTRAPVDGDTDS